MRTCGKLLFLATSFSLQSFAASISFPKAFTSKAFTSKTSKSQSLILRAEVQFRRLEKVMARVQEVLDEVMERFQEVLETGWRAYVLYSTGSVGCVLTMLAVKKAIEVAATVVITVLVVRITGILNDIPVSRELRQDFANTIKKYAKEMRRQVAEREFQAKIKLFFQKERLAAYGFAAGVLEGLFAWFVVFRK